MDFLYPEPNVINVFTDASTSAAETSYDNLIISPGFIMVNQCKNINQGFTIWKGSSSFGEMYALFMGVNEIYRDAWYQRSRGLDPNTCRIYNVFSDSRYALDSIKYWVHDWIKKAGPVEYFWSPMHHTYIPKIPIWKKSSINEPVMHQDLILQVMWVILSAQVQIHFYHIKGHFNWDDPRKVERAKAMFCDYAKIKRIPIEYIRDMIYWNNAIDTMTRSGMKTLLANNITKNQTLLAEKPKWTIGFYPTPEQMIAYQYLVK